ncbi:hypothetical protein AB4Y40_40940 [Paraburkholderia sp. EG287B]|uniref:hypothetical protein n=1 Tax=Paraburkholderia sp. EG287B TaxID=3237010 RepID=UPI0034D2EA1A
MFRKHHLSEVNHLATRLSEEVAAYQPDVVLYIHGKRVKIFQLRESKVLKAGWWVEQDDNWSELEVATRDFDLYFAFAPAVVERFSRMAVRLATCRTVPMFVSTIRLLALPKKSIWYFSAPGVRGAIRSLLARSR